MQPSVNTLSSEPGETIERITTKHGRFYDRKAIKTVREVQQAAQKKVLVSYENEH